MPGVLSKLNLLTELKSKAAALGLSLQEEGEEGLKGELESIRAKWVFGGRKVIYRMSFRLVEAERAVLFREAVVERSWGLPPPTMTVEKETITGWKRSGERTDVSLGGGGSINYAQVRDSVEQAVTAAGWTFQLQGGRMP